ncbi:transcriptional regulator, TetR family [Desulfacinum infernum DSM 9756]|uniref:Transcriptional regulator, TetR family n=1 Tax=Desulfacinum infernum DSM 9756 TaxID=1121391 RepID=A0A1M5ILF9_9BACT|nr:TetR/AcrR family transcriptional regulator [Desulfacinum infernum]SHG29194.1 transcriptional regulator, TetR family [Desulfacinum infernum DSM 9756]
MSEKGTFQRLRKQEKEARRQIILDAAERVFGTCPFDKVSMRQIAKEAGISPAAIYRYFPDQQALFIESFLTGARRLVHRIKKIVDNHGTPNDVAAEVIAFLWENDHYFRMMTHFMLHGEIREELLERLNEMERRVLDHFQAVFRQDARSAESRLVAHAFFAALNGVLITFHNYPGRRPEDVRRHMERVAEVIADLFVKGLQAGSPVGSA